MRSTLSSPARIVAVLCLAEILGMTPFSMFLALQTDLRTTWQLSNMAAGWISSGYYAGYMVAVPILVSLTDRTDARSIWLASTALAAVSAAAFGTFADGFWTAFICQVGAGAGLAGTYMPGLKVITDRLPAVPHPRYVAFYTTSFTFGSSLSFYWLGQLVETMSWRRAVATIVVGPAMAWALVFLMIRPKPLAASAPAAAHGRWRQVARSAETVRYIVGYASHTWELFGLRVWLVPFLTFCVARQGSGTFGSPQTLAALVGLIGVPASLAGAELSARVNRRTLIVTVMMVSSAASVAFGLSSMTNWTLILLAAFLYSAVVSADSAALTSGLVAVAPAGSRGTAMAIYSTCGFGAAAAGSAVVGSILDFSGGESVASWTIAFGALGAANLLSAGLLMRGPRNGRSLPAAP